jgi:phosphoribosylglycinamide formyltransferase 1
MKAISEACRDGSLDAEPVLVISNNSGPQAFARAEILGLKTFHMSARTHPGDGALDLAICSALCSEDINVVVLSGYMRKIGPQTLKTFHNRILNVHPALLPKYGGQGFYGERVHQAVLDAGDTESGATIHIVEGEYDTGPILVQGRVPVLPDDTAHTLAARVAGVEHEIYIEAIQKIASGEISLN